MKDGGWPVKKGLKGPACAAILSETTLGRGRMPFFFSSRQLKRERLVLALSRKMRPYESQRHMLY